MDSTTFNHLPYKFEAGTGNVLDEIGLAEALDYIKGIGMDKIESSSVRATLAIYNTEEEVNAFTDSIMSLVKYFPIYR